MLPKRKKGWDKNQQVNTSHEEVSTVICEEANSNSNIPVLKEVDVKVKINNSKFLIRVYYNNKHHVDSIAWLEQHYGYDEETDMEECYYEATDFVITKILELHLLDIKDLVDLSTDDVSYYPIYTDLLVELVKLEQQISKISSDINEIRWDHLNNY